MPRLQQPDYPTYGPGIYVPPRWGQFWHAALQRSQAGLGNATLAWTGDSIMYGLYASNVLTTSSWAILKSTLQTNFGNGGSGFSSATNSPPFWATTATKTYYTGITNNYWTESGTWTNFALNYGPGYVCALSTASGSTITIPFTGTTLTIYYANGGPGFTYKVDGGSINTVTAGGGAGLGTYAIATSVLGSLTAGAHTVVITTAGTTEGAYICGISGTNATGVIVNNYCLPGLSSVVMRNSTNATPTFEDGVWMGGFEYPADCVMYSMGANDANNQATTGDGFVGNIQRYLAGVLDIDHGGSAVGATDILFVIPHWGTYDNPTYLGMTYRSRMYDLALAYNAALVDFNTLGRNSWNYWNSLGYWGNAANPAIAGTDTVHPSDAGHAYIANVLYQILGSTAAAPV